MLIFREIWYLIFEIYNECKLIENMMIVYIINENGGEDIVLKNLVGYGCKWIRCCSYVGE